MGLKLNSYYLLEWSKHELTWPFTLNGQNNRKKRQRWGGVIPVQPYFKEFYA